MASGQASGVGCPQVGMCGAGCPAAAIYLRSAGAGRHMSCRSSSCLPATFYTIPKGTSVGVAGMVSRNRYLAVSGVDSCYGQVHSTTPLIGLSVNTEPIPVVGDVLYSSVCSPVTCTGHCRSVSLCCCQALWSIAAYGLCYARCVSCGWCDILCPASAISHGASMAMGSGGSLGGAMMRL